MNISNQAQILKWTIDQQRHAESYPGAYNHREVGSVDQLSSSAMTP